MFKQMLSEPTQSTKNSGNIIRTAMKETFTRVNRMKTQPVEIPIKVKYKNWKGEIGIRTIIPLSVQYNHTEYHTKNQWLMEVWDVEKDALRTYAMMDIIEFIKEED